MTLTSDDVARLAGLARIELTADELAHLAPQLDVIVDAVAGVAQVMGQDIPPTSHSVALVNVMRPDEPAPAAPPGLRDQLAAGAPAWEDDKFRVPRILEEETA